MNVVVAPDVLIIILCKMRVIICVKVYPFIVFIYLKKVNENGGSDFN